MEEEIYLQPNGNGEWEGITWCEDKQNDEDVKYIRADIVESKLEKK
jgi:hypothetical protein